MIKKLSKEKKVYLVSIAIVIFVISIGLISGITGVLGNSIILSILILIFPYFFFRYEKYRRIREIEERFPAFLHDLTESIRSGVPLPKAIQNASKVNYGKYLSKEVKKMANQISWGMAVDKVLDQFDERVKSKKISAGIKIIKEAYLAGGDVASILDAVAESTNLLREAERERKAILSQYVVLMYAISLLFIVIVVAINKLLIPIFEGGIGEEEMLFANPCWECVGLNCYVCSFYEFVSIYFLKLEMGEVAKYYTTFFFLMAIVQSFFAGIVAGQISEKSLIAGLKHSLILVGITWGTFLILLQIGLLG